MRLDQWQEFAFFFANNLNYCPCKSGEITREHASLKVWYMARTSVSKTVESG